MQALAGRVVLATGGATSIADMSPSTHRLTEPHGTG